MSYDESTGESRSLLNPYPYQNEIEEEGNFVGREEIREKILYYLEQASLGEFYNIAITGETSIGKSSLLNMIRIDAEDFDVLPIKVPLDRMNTVSELEFFRELYEVILSEGVDQDQIDQSVFDRFKKAISGKVDAEASIGYSSTYFKLKGSGNQTSSVRRQEVVDDLSGLVEDELESSAMVLLVDDIEVFSNYELFRKFESIISDLHGYQMVLAGTHLEEILPEEYTPLSQSFTSFELGPFSDVEHTRECLLNPLAENEEDDFEADVGEIHALSGGSPFEIRLIAHHMYREYADSKEKLTLTRGILDEVAESLLNSNPRREIADQVKQLNSDYLLVVVAAVEFPKISAEQLAKCTFLYHIDSLPADITTVETRRKQILDQLVSGDILSEENDAIEFNGSWFDRMYLKYHAAAVGVIDEDYNLNPGDEDHLPSNIHEKIVTQHLLDDLGETRGTTRFDMEYYPENSEGEKHNLQWKHFVTEVTVSADDWTIVDVYNPDRREEIFQQIPNAMWFRCNIEWLEHGFLTQVIFLDDTEDQREELKDRVEDLAEKLGSLGYQLFLENEMTWYHRGLNKLEEGEQFTALKCFEKAIGIYPMFGLAWDRRGVVLQSLNQNMEAMVSYEMALEFDPALNNSRANKAIILADEGLYREAASILEELTENDSDYTTAWLLLSRVRAELGDVEGSNQALEEAL